MFRRIFPALFVCVALSVAAAAQYRFDAWTTDNALPHNYVHSILQSRTGYLWLTTLDGLVRYDGVRFTVFNAGNSPGFPGNRLTALFEDSAGALWIGTESDGLVRMQSGKFDLYTTKEGLPDNYVAAIDEGKNGALRIATRDGFARFENGRFVLHAPDRPGLAKIFGYRGRGGPVWESLGEGKFASAIATSYRALRIPPPTPIYSLHEDRAGNLWIGTQAGLIQFRDAAPRLYSEKDGLPNKVVVTVKENRAGELWFGTGGGLCRFKDGRFVNIGLTGSYITDILEDREGTLWIATWGKGLHRLSKQAITTYSDQHGLAANNVYPIFQNRAGEIWLGTWGRGLTHYRDGRFTRFPDQNGLPGSLVTALAEDAAGGLWIGTFGGALRLGNGKLSNHSASLSLPGPAVHAILQDRTGGLWFGTNNGLVEHRNGHSTVYTEKEGLAGNDVHAILEDRQGRMWIGTFAGLTQIASGRLKSWTRQDGLKSNRIRSLHEDAAGNIWIGTYDGGLARLKDGRIVAITQDNGLFNNGVFQILDDARGNFWMSCNLGIYRVSQQQLNDFAEGNISTVTSIVYGKGDGMLDAECNGGYQPAGVRTHDGKLWFPTQKDAAVIDPATITINPLPPPVTIESARVDSLPVGDGQAVQMAAGQRTLEIHYTALSFIKPEQIRFKYKLEGLQENWVDAGTQRLAYFSNVPPGEYVFRVMAANSDGVWNTEGSILRVTALPFFYQTHWFLSLILLSAAALAFALYRRRIAELKRANAAQEEFSRRLIESQEGERKRIAAELHDSLGQSLAIIRNHALFGLHADADANSAGEQFERISQQASQAIDEVKDISYNLRPYLLDRLGLSKALEAMIDRVAESSGIALTSEIADLNGIFSKEAEINLYRIVQESLNNIVKHAEASAASVRITRVESEVEVMIHDDGKGFDRTESGLRTAELKRRITASLSPPPSTIRNPRSGGFGLIGIAERARMLGGELMIHSALGQGVTIKIVLPLKDRKE